MNESLHDYMKVGLVHFMAFPECMGGAGPIVETVEALVRDPFLEVLEITRIDDAEQRHAVRDLAGHARVELSFGAQPVQLSGGLDLNHPDAGERAKAVEALQLCIDEAQEMGIEGLAVLSGKAAEEKAAATGRLVDALKELCAYGAERGVSVVLETFDQVPYGKNCLIGPTVEAVAVSETVRADYPDFGLMLDLSHLPLLGETPTEAIHTAGEHLVRVHMGNCAMDDPDHPAYGDSHPRFGAPGTRNDAPALTEFLRALLDTGYLTRERRGTVSFEVKPMAGEDPWGVIAGSKRTLLEAWRHV